MVPSLSAAGIHQGPGRLWLYVQEPASGSRLILEADGSPAQPSGIAAWAATTPYTRGTLVKDSNNNTEVCIVAGTSGGSAPVWPTTQGPGAGAVLDGSAVWLFCGGAYGGYFGGATEGAMTIDMSPKYAEIGADQVDLPVDVVHTGSAYEIDAIIKQSNLANLISFFPPGTFAVGTDTAQPSGAQAYEEITFGGIVPINSMSVAVISPRRDVTGKYVVAQIYKAYAAEAFKLGYTRTKETTFSVKFKAIADTTRTVGDQAGQVWRQV